MTDPILSPAQGLLSFRHAIDVAQNTDGGIVEIWTDSQGWSPLPADAFSKGGYNGAISGGG